MPYKLLSFLYLTRVGTNGELVFSSSYYSNQNVECIIVVSHNLDVCRYKNNGQNFHINLPMERNVEHSVSVPEDLVQIQAYLRWERNGKQNYSPEKEKVRRCTKYKQIVKDIFFVFTFYVVLVFT